MNDFICKTTVDPYIDKGFIKVSPPMATPECASSCIGELRFSQTDNPEGSYLATSQSRKINPVETRN